MAKLFPEMDTIKKLLQPPTDGELYILNCLTQLNDDYEIYFQPNIYGDHPDVVVMNKKFGIVIIEVKDYCHGHYCFHNGYWTLAKDGTMIKSPISQVECYRDNLIYKNCLSISKKVKAVKALGNTDVFSLISRMVYLHEMVEDDVKAIKMYQDAKYVHVISHDMIKKGYSILPPRFNNMGRYFDDEIYSEMQRILMPSVNSLENTQTIYYTKVQQKFIDSSPARRVIKGVAGSGKTLVLAQMAVNAYLRTKKPVLILTYNITMCNYIHDRLSAVRGYIRWSCFRIQHYHGFIKEECKHCGIELPQSQSGGIDENENAFYRNLDLFFGKNSLPQYDAVFIDEGQDYEYNWMKIIDKYFLAKNGEFVIFCDEKQNIYNRPLENKKVHTPIVGAPGVLNESYRLSGNTISLANDFQNAFLAERYDLDFIPVQQTLENSYLLYAYAERSALSVYMEALFKFLFNKKRIHPNDIFVIGFTRKIVQTIFNILNGKICSKCDITVLTDDEEREIEMQVRINCAELSDYAIQRKIKKRIKDEERPKKHHFWMNSGCVKLTTIQSMKGWESNTVILLIEKNNEGDILLDETIYSGITRSKNDLIIINIENEKYDKFFKKECAKGIMLHWA
jgi:hypothetical protein